MLRPVLRELQEGTAELHEEAERYVRILDADASRAELERVLASSSDEIAALVMEPMIQGAAGMLVHPPGFLRFARELCTRHGVHLIVDEVATGFGRTGRLFACEHEEVHPDFLCVAKGITGGYLPLAATLSTEEVFGAFLGARTELKHFFHGHTYTANPLACAVALESLALLRDQTLANARSLLDPFSTALGCLAALPEVLGTRHCGLMGGIELRSEDPLAGAKVCDRARRHGVILRPLGNVLVWMPPLTSTHADLDLLERATSAAILESA
jgi:adenosylmethionine-8-amino-7-oxononanoate aminotransferase